MALVKAASEREEPIPVFAEMGSSNPIFILPEKIKSAGNEVAKQIAGSVNLGAGQFCTNPGILVVLKDKHTSLFLKSLESAFEALPISTMLNKSIFESFEKNKQTCLSSQDVQTLYNAGNSENAWKAHPAIATVPAKAFLKHPGLQEEVFGPFTLMVICENPTEVHEIAQSLQGQLTASLIGEASEFEAWSMLSDLLSEKVGRLIYNGVPTGVEVCHAMQHGGPFPASTDSRFTSVGTGAILRFSRPVCYQNCPDSLLPDELKNDNPHNIWRMVNGKLVR